jgi:CheY-like chemotaxis protein
MSTKRILLIDDEKSICFAIQMCLNELADWTVLIADSSADGLHQAQLEKPDAILLDLMMPEMDGFTVLRKLKENPETYDIAVILMTAEVQSGGFKPSDERQLSGILAKPLDALTLVDQISNILHW